MKVLLIQHDSFINGNGGTEKICSFLANGLIEKGCVVVIAVNQAAGGLPVFKLNSGVLVQNIYDPNLKFTSLLPISRYDGRNPLYWMWGKLKRKYEKAINYWRCSRFVDGEAGVFKHNLKLRSALWQKYIDTCKPDVIVTMSISSLLEITYDNDVKIPIVNSVNGRTDYDYTDIISYRPVYLMDLLRTSFSKLRGVQILFENYEEFLPRDFKGVVKVISNPVFQVQKADLVDHISRRRRRKIINLARLDTECKQQHLAIDVFATLANRYPDWDLEFWGTGKDWTKLEKQIKNLGLEERIFLRGFDSRPIKILQSADIFLFPSKYEGFGLALAEAMSVGLPSVGFASCSGVNQLIIHEESGFLAENTAEMSKYLELLMVNEKLRKSMGERANNQVKCYSEERILKMWMDFLKEITEN